MNHITDIKCIIPFTKLSVRDFGDFYSCCPSWTKLGKIGALTDYQSIQDIWNSERIQYIREAILEDKLEKVCDFRYCPFAIKNQNLELAALKNNDARFNRILDQIMMGKTCLDSLPYQFEVAHSRQCNLNCTMCHPRWDKHSDNRLNEKIFTQVIPEMLPGLSRLLLAAQGEVLFNPYSRHFLRSLDAKRYPELQIQLLTNGNLLNPRMWDSINHLQYDSIFVSVNAASKATYENIHLKGNWDILRKNLSFISELRRRKIFKEFNISFIVMRSNYKEMKDFVKLGLELGCDSIFFQKIIGLETAAENINFIHDRKIFSEIAQILSDPIFARPEVDTAIIDDYRAYAIIKQHRYHFFINSIKKVFTLLISIMKLLVSLFPLRDFRARLRTLLTRKELRWKLRLGFHS